MQITGVQNSGTAIIPQSDALSKAPKSSEEHSHQKQQPNSDSQLLQKRSIEVLTTGNDDENSKPLAKRRGSASLQSVGSLAELEVDRAKQADGADGADGAVAGDEVVEEGELRPL